MKSTTVPPVVCERLPHRKRLLPDDATAENIFIIGKAVINTDCAGCAADRTLVLLRRLSHEAMELDENNCPVVIEDKCNGCGACESVCVRCRTAPSPEGSYRARHRRPPA